MARKSDDDDDDYSLENAVIVPLSEKTLRALGRSGKQADAIVSDFPPFTKTTRAWLERLAVARHASTLKLAHFLRYRAYKGDTEVIVSLAATKAWGLSKESRQTAIAELEGLGLVRLLTRQKRLHAPKVAIIR